MSIQFKKTGSQQELHLYKAENIDAWFLSPDDSEEPLTLKDSWDRPGMYIFTSVEASGAEASTAGFAEASRQLLEKASQMWLSYGPDLGLLWVENASDDSHLWRCHALLLDNEKKIQRQWGFSWSGYHLEFYRAIAVKCQEDKFVLSSADGNDAFGALQTQGLRLICGPKAEIGFGAQNGVPVGSLNFAAAGQGGDGDNIFQLLDAGMYYSREYVESKEIDDTKESDEKKEIEDAQQLQGNKESDDTDRESGYLSTLYNPVLVWPKSITLDCTLKPSAILQTDYTFFSLPVKNILEKSLETFLVNTRGDCLQLQCTDSSGLVFQQRPLYLYGGLGEEAKSKKRYYLGLSGNFEISQTKLGKKLEVMCGLTGTETLQFSDTHKIIQFVPGNKAFIGNQDTLTDAATVSWIRFPKDSLYFSQPGSAPLFSEQANKADNVNNSNRTIKPTLRFHPLALRKMGEMEEPVPIFPYFNSRLNSPELIGSDYFEAALFGQRYKILAPIGTEPQPNAAGAAGRPNASPLSSSNLKKEEVLTVSPQGLLVGLNGPGVLATWQWIALGCKQSTKKICFEGIKPALKSKFQQADLFGLYTRKEDFTDLVDKVTNFELNFSGWNFQFQPDKWRSAADHNNTATIMLVKFSIDKSIRELLGDNAVFKQSLAQCYDEQKKARPEYASFLRVVNNRMFQGTVVLNCAVTPSGKQNQEQSALPSLLNGISQEDIDKLYAHHVVIHKSRIKQSKSKGLNLEKSSISALVEFTQGKAITYSEKDGERNEAEYTTVSFLLRIEDNEIVEVSSISELLLNRLFGAPCRKEGNEGGGCLILDGRLKQESGQSLYVYRLRSGELFSLGGGMLEQVLCENISLSFAGEVGSFELSGRLYFAEQDLCDLFSYGFEKEVKPQNEQPGEQQGGVDQKKEDKPEEGSKDKSLAFTGLKIKMPGGGGKLKCNYGDIVLQPEPDKGRTNSLTNRFPVQLLGLIEHSKSKTPQKCGYNHVQSGVRQSPLTASCWYGLVWRIPLGSLGDLSEGSSLDIELLTAWCAGSATDAEASPGCWIGVKLPTALGGQGLDVQGLLKLGFHSVEILSARNTKSNLVDYSLALNQFKITVLGVSFPPGTSKIHIVADDGGKNLGWYGSYADEEKETASDSPKR